jgi:multidrug efflux pump subunit AcrA (membrane-fusion protein)
VAIPYVEISALRIGQTQSIALEAGGAMTQATGKVTFISPVADAASGLVEVRITFSNSQLGFKPGIKGSIQVPSQTTAR